MRRTLRQVQVLFDCMFATQPGFCAVVLNMKLTYFHTQKTLKERGIDTMLEEARKNTPETDAEYNRRS